MVDSPYLNAREAAEYLRLPSVKALYNLIERVCGSRNRKRRKLLFTREELDKLRLGENPWED